MQRHILAAVLAACGWSTSCANDPLMAHYEPFDLDVIGEDTSQDGNSERAQDFIDAEGSRAPAFDTLSGSGLVEDDSNDTSFNDTTERTTYDHQAYLSTQTHSYTAMTYFVQVVHPKEDTQAEWDIIEDVTSDESPQVCLDDQNIGESPDGVTFTFNACAVRFKIVFPDGSVGCQMQDGSVYLHPNIHSIGLVILWPFGFDYYVHPDDTTFWIDQTGHCAFEFILDGPDGCPNMSRD